MRETRAEWWRDVFVRFANLSAGLVIGGGVMGGWMDLRGIGNTMFALLFASLGAKAVAILIDAPH